jgi:hypothetical protein
VAIWLPEGLVILYLKAGELVNASLDTGRLRKPLALSDALARVPAEPEWGEICFSEAPLEQLTCMFVSHSTTPLPAPQASAGGNGDALGHLHTEQFSGLVELVLDGHMNYLIFEKGTVARGYLSGASQKPLVERAARTLSDSAKVGQLIRLYPLEGGAEHPAQAQPQLIRSYRDLMRSLVEQLIKDGRSSAAAIAEHARITLLTKHPSLTGFSPEPASQFDPVCTTAELSRDIAAWATETVWADMDIENGAPQDLLRCVTHERRHMFQSAGFFEHIPWKIEW